jgi:hypothetical protein
MMPRAQLRRTTQCRQPRGVRERLPSKVRGSMRKKETDGASQRPLFLAWCMDVCNMSDQDPVGGVQGLPWCRMRHWRRRTPVSGPR